MKKKFLVTLTPPKLTKQLKEEIEKDVPIVSQKLWGKRKAYKYNSYIKAKVEKGYLILSIFKTEFVRSGSKYPTYVVYFNRKSEEYISFETEIGKWRTAMLNNLDTDFSYYSSQHYISEKDGIKIQKYLKIERGNLLAICDYQSSVLEKHRDKQYKRITDEWDRMLKPVRSLPKDWEKWVLRKAISEHYIFYQYKRSGPTDGYCTCCGKKVVIEKPKYNEKGVCPNCGQKVQFKSIGKFGPIWTKQETAYLLQRCYPGFIIREFSVRMAIGKNSYQNPVAICSEKNRYLYDMDFKETKLYKRHNDLIKYIEDNQLSVTAGELADKYPNINSVLSGLREKYEYSDETFTILAPRCIEDILKEGQALHHCIDKKTEYLERINEQETYILFLRNTKQPDTPYYTLEVEPGGVIRQKRTEYDRQNKDIEAASAFLREWQLEIQKRITENDRELANRSRQLRMESYAEMRKKKVKINGGLFQGKYLADVLEADLMEMPDTLQQAA